MQALSRACASLRGAWVQTSRVTTRSFSEAAEAAATAQGTEAQREGAKSILFRILGTATEPMTAGQVWEAAEKAGLKSKRFTKQMLAQLKEAGWVKTARVVGAKRQNQFGYQLNMRRQQERQAKLQRREARAAKSASSTQAAAAAQGA